jgi:hypothetical protein
MLLRPETLYFELGRLLAEMPELAFGPITPEVQRWLASTNSIVKSSGSLTEPLQLTVASENLDGPSRVRNAETITNILYRMFIQAEANAPGEVRGSVLLIGGGLDAYRAIGRLLATASSDAFLIEPDADGKILADYAILAPERTTVRLLADEAEYRPSLVGGVQRWQQRFGDNRNLMVRVASANTLFERLILLDSERGWVLGAPFTQLAKRTHSTLVRMRAEDEARKMELYAEIWEEAKPLSLRS